MELEHIEINGKSIGCVASYPDKIMAISPNGISRQCDDRSSAVYWLEEIDAGRNPERKSRFTEIFLLVVVLFATIVIYVPSFFKGGE